MSIISPLPTLTTDTSSVVFSFLDFKDLCRACPVSKAWQAFASQDCFWKSCFPFFSKYTEKDFKNYASSHCVTTITQIELSAKKIFEDTPILNAEFRVFFPDHKNCFFKVFGTDPISTLYSEKTIFFVGNQLELIDGSTNLYQSGNYCYFHPDAYNVTLSCTGANFDSEVVWKTISRAFHESSQQIENERMFKYNLDRGMTALKCIVTAGSFFLGYMMG